MNDEQILLDDLNAFEDFMENADVEKIKKEHGLSSNNEFKVGKFYNFYITSRTKEQIKLSCRANGTARVGNFTVYRYKNGEFICEKADYLSGLSYDDTYYHRIFDCSNTKRVIISTVDFFSALSNDDLVKLYNSKFDFSILDTPKVDLEVVQKEQYPSFEIGSYGNSKIVKVTFDYVYVTSKHMAGGVSSIPFGLFSDDYGQYIIAYDNMVRCSGLDISSLPLECVYRLENAYRLRFYKTYLNPVVEVVQGEIVESAEQIHNRICDNFAIVEKTLYEICVDLKSIRDNKHYKTLGYNTFEQYCLENFNIKRSQVYSYISIAENLSNDFVQSTGQIGVQKLYCLSRLTDEERSELIQTTDIENTPVKQLEQKSREIKENREVQVKENDVVPNVVELNKPTGHLTFKDICLIFDFDSYKTYFVTYDNVDVDNNLVSNYNYLVRTFKKFLNNDYSFNDDIFNSLSDLLEISKRFADGLYDFKQYLKKEKEKEILKKKEKNKDSK